ncbi:MAG: recombination protein RecR [Saprospiraceae bacterium]|nr:recombination protein RecR [Saprospiraceae bacterium]
MKVQSKKLEGVVNAFATLPGIGKKSALRIAIHLLADNTDKKSIFKEAVEALEGVRNCSCCYNLSDEEICAICKDPRRNASVVCVVEHIQDIMAIEETGQFNGLYHVLGGVISPIEGIGPDDLHIESLLSRVKRGNVREIIMAVSPTIDGETTIYYLSQKLGELDVSVSQIARGVAFGGELQYTDEITLGRSILARIPYAINGKS